MRAVIHVEVANRQQARDIEVGLQQPDVQAFAMVCGVLAQLPTDRARQRVLTFFSDHFADPVNAAPAATDEAGGEVR
jgi:hypothetical protein